MREGSYMVKYHNEDIDATILKVDEEFQKMWNKYTDFADDIHFELLTSVLAHIENLKFKDAS